MPHMKDLRLSGPDLDTREALELRPRLAALADHASQPIADGFTVGHELRAVPPRLLIEMQQLRTDDHQSDEDGAAQESERESDPSIQRPQPDAARQVAEQHAAQPSDQQQDHHASDPRRNLRVRQIAAEVRDDQRTELPGRPDRNDPEHQRHRLAHETAQESDDRGAQQNQHNENIGPGQAFTLTPWRPSARPGAFY